MKIKRGQMSQINVCFFLLRFTSSFLIYHRAYYVGGGVPLSRLKRWFTAETKKKKKSDGRDFLFSFFFFFFCGFIQQQKKIFSFSSFLLNFSYKGGERDNGRKPACITRLISACAQTPHFLTYTQTHCLVNCVHTNPHFLKKWFFSGL